MTDRRLLTVSIAAFVLATLVAIPLFVGAQPAEPAPAVVVESAPDPLVINSPHPPADLNTPEVPKAEEEVTSEALGKQIKKTVSDWRTYGWLAGLGALIALLVMVLKYKPIDALFVRWEVKYLKPLIACILGGASAGIVSYLADGDVVNAIIAGLVIIGPVAVGYFETFSKIKSRNRDNGKMPKTEDTQ